MVLEGKINNPANYGMHEILHGFGNASESMQEI